MVPSCKVHAFNLEFQVFAILNPNCRFHILRPSFKILIATFHVYRSQFQFFMRCAPSFKLVLFVEFRGVHFVTASFVHLRLFSQGALRIPLGRAKSLRWWHREGHKYQLVCADSKNSVASTIGIGPPLAWCHRWKRLLHPPLAWGQYL